jgi:hypothetical protein
MDRHSDRESANNTHNYLELTPLGRPEEGMEGTRPRDAHGDGCLVVLENEMGDPGHMPYSAAGFHLALDDMEALLDREVGKPVAEDATSSSAPCRTSRPPEGRRQAGRAESEGAGRRPRSSGLAARPRHSSAGSAISWRVRRSSSPLT